MVADNMHSQRYAGLSIAVVCLIMLLGGTARFVTQPCLCSTTSNFRPVPAVHQPITVVAGVMVTKDVSAALINAFHYSVQDYNAAQADVQVLLKFYIGNTSHPLLDEELAVDNTDGHIDNFKQHRYLPQFVKGSFAENMNDGKTPEWFRWAAASFPFSHWIFKVDTDTSIDWFAFGALVIDTQRDMRYFGIINDNIRCGGGGHCPPVGCLNMSGSCWMYMSGGFYGVSTQLAKVLNECKYYKEHGTGTEDLQFGLAVKYCTPDVDALQIIGVPLGKGWCHSKKATPTHVRLGQMPSGCW